ncbi:uncharacterized protein LOC114934598 isoform X3 [Nylanderia fulva]|uniref:uncharacterized protein LOC114934598 isoform X3 n=1 Tax=Nylanderia fulva TaxID=613905 RepID=UPI0010FB30AE|nr:uncharacterized protein LOC114934598 isoform X3 [Nylanderia fulva]
MVSFKSNNVPSEQSTPHRHLPGTLRVTLSHSHNHQHNHSHRHEPAPLLPAPYLTPPPPPASSYITVQRGCALHSRLDQPVTSSTPGMDNKKIVQSATPPAVPVQVRSKHDGSGVAASVSGVRRRSGPQGGLRSPAAKRPLSAPVALQGWLHKQGSEGLMLWKKRWFVLSEYCLFYYKGPEEEKLLGSILLPSYRVTVCKPEDKVNKKFAFKAEHANMRTYHFAADSRESMNQWVNALTLATLLQDPSPGMGEAAVVIEIAQDGERSARPSVSSISSILNQSADDSDSGFHGFQSRDDPSHASNNNSSPNSANTASFPNLSSSNSNGNSASNNHGSDSGHPMMNGWVPQPISNYGQPSTSQPQSQQQQQQQQYGHLQQLQPNHSHQHQALLHQHLPQANVLPPHQSSHPHKHMLQQSPQQQQQQQSSQSMPHPIAGNVQTVQPMSRKFGQPIYANAPPKPRRLTDGSNEYSTPSPDPDYRKSPVSPDVTVTSKSPMSDYERSNTIYGTRMNQPPQHQSLRTDKSGLNYGYGQIAQPTERRTPDTYGRSAKPRTSSRGNGDYEELYGTPPLYQRPAGPVGYTKGASPAPIPIPVYAQQQHLQQLLHSPVTPPHMPMKTRIQPPPRPHSADFLEYEATRRPQQQPAQCERPPDQQRRPQRPKSSLDIVNPSDATNDGYFYSEERYAAQMRQSAVYLHQTPQHYQQQRNQSLSRVTMQPKLPGIRDKTDESRIAILPDSTCPALRRTQRDHVHGQHTMPPQSLTQRHSEIMGNDPKFRRSLREKSYEANGREMITHGGEDNTIPRRVPRGEYDGWGRTTSHSVHGTHIAQTYHAGGHAGGGRRWSEQQQFCRSASARLPRTRHPAALDPDDDDYAERSSEQDSRDGERKIQQREESMKRLLEWKQRMLQSPLTRKPSGSANRGRAQNDLSSYYKQQALLDLAAHEAAVAEGRHSRRREDGHRSHVRSKSSDGRRTAVNVPRYNSYSSDDEASGSGSVIGRDPLPPRAVSTSHLPQRTLTQPPTAVSTLPLPRSNAGHRQPLPLHRSTPQQQASMRQMDGETTAQMLRAVSNGDIVKGPAMVTGNEMRDLRLASPSGHSTQRLISPVGHLRVASLNDHRVSSPSDSEIHVHSPNERKMMSSIGRDLDRGGTTTTPTSQRQNQQQRMRADCSELLHKRARLAELDTPRRLENLQKLEELKRHLMDLEKQYEKSKPLVNLVDNMVKLGSLYNRNTANGTSNVSGSRHDLMHENARDHRDRLEFNQRVQEQRLLAEERRDWDRLSPDHGQLQAKVQQLYKLDRLLQEESGTLHSLQQDKEILEKALGGLRHKLQGSRSNLAEAERYRKQQLLLERELSRVRVLLAHNSKVKPVFFQKLEETVAENARLEQDLVVLRQKVQASRRYAGNITRDTPSTTAPLEAELRRMQQLVGDLQRQRKELSVQVRQLTEKSHSLVQQIRPQPLHAPQVHQPKKRTQNSWLETDLDSGITLDHGLDSPSSPSLSISPPNRQNDNSHQRYGSPTQYKDLSPLNRPQNQSFVQPSQNHISALSPQLREQIQQHQLKQQLLKDQMQGKGSAIQVAPLYVNTDSRITGDYIIDTSKHNGNMLLNGTPNFAPEYIPPPPPPPPLNEETLLLNDNYRQNEDNKFAGLMHNREKQEIKTVRIVKRESERRQRDRGDRTGNIGIPLTNGLQAPGSAKRLCDDDLGGSQKFEKAQLGRVVEESPSIIHAQSTVQLSELDDVQFQRSMSLPRGFGGQKQNSAGIHYGPVVPPPRSDSMHALKSMMARRHKIRFENHDGSSDSTLSPYTDSPTSSSYIPMSSPNYSTASSYSPSQNQNYPSQAAMVIAQPHYPNQPNHPFGPPYRQYDKIATLADTASSELTSTTNSGVHDARPIPVAAATTNANKSESPQLSPVFKSEAAKQIIKEMTEKKVEGPRRRQIPREKRRHYTVSSSKPVLDLEDTFSKMGMGRARDDLDMERALRPRINAPDVVRSTLSHKELKYNESTIDQLLGTPNKIVIPERYIPEQTPELTAEEQEQRLKKAEAIRKMLSETTVTAPEGGDDDSNVEKSDTLKRKVVEEKRQREHILQLNQILAKQVMEKSKMVAVKALATLPLKTESSLDDEDLSPVASLPLYQQRENYYS